MSDPNSRSVAADAEPHIDLVVREIAALEAECVEVDGQVVQVAVSTWAIYGHTTYDGEIIVGEYASVAEANAVWCAAPRLDVPPRAPDDAA